MIDEAHMRHLWEQTPTTAREIAALHGTTKNAVIGRAHRRGWLRYGSSRAATTLDRMAALEARLVAVLAETAPRPEHYLCAPPVVDIAA